jgi:hypothetical protein
MSYPYGDPKPPYVDVDAFCTCKGYCNKLLLGIGSRALLKFIGKFAYFIFPRREGFKKPYDCCILVNPSVWMYNFLHHLPPEDLAPNVFKPWITGYFTQVPHLDGG